MTPDLDRIFRAPWKRELARLYLAEVARGPSTGRLLWYTGKSVLGLHPTVTSTAENGHSDILTRLRDLGLIHPASIIDETRHIWWPDTWATLRDAAKSAVKTARLDPWIDATAPMIWCESSSLANLLNEVTAKWGVASVPFRGQASYGLLWELARHVEPMQKVFYLGDWNKAGTDIEHSGVTRVTRYARRQGRRPIIDVNRLALTDSQVVAESLPVIRKRVAINQHASEMQDSVEIEALGRDRIIELVEDAIKGEADAQGVDLAATKVKEDTERKKIDTLLALTATELTPSHVKAMGDILDEEE